MCCRQTIANASPNAQPRKPSRLNSRKFKRITRSLRQSGSNDGDRNIADLASNLALPEFRSGFMHRYATAVDRHRHRHVANLELVDRLHAEILEAEHLGRADRLGEIGRAHV